MVKIKGFTLIELMIVIAIIGILFSIVVGPARDKYKETSLNNEGWNGNGDMDTNNSDIMMINGIPHTCNEFGVCEKAD